MIKKFIFNLILFYFKKKALLISSIKLLIIDNNYLKLF